MGRNYKLSPRARQVARILLSSGANNPEISRQIGIGVYTVKHSYVRELLDLTGQDGRLAATLFILRDPYLLAEVMEARF